MMNPNSRTRLRIAPGGDELDLSDSDPESVESDGLSSILLWAVENNNERVVLALAALVDLNKRARFGRIKKFPLHLACQKGSKSIVRVLLSNGANPNLQDKKGYTALFYADDDDMVYTLLLHGKDLDPNILDHEGRSATHLHVEMRRRVCTSILEHDEIDLNLQDKQGRTILHQAVLQRCHLHDIKALITRGADCDKQDFDGNTALHFAVNSGSGDVVKLLVERGIDTVLSNNKGMTALDVLCKRLKKNRKRKRTGEKSYFATGSIDADKMMYKLLQRSVMENGHQRGKPNNGGS